MAVTRQRQTGATHGTSHPSFGIGPSGRSLKKGIHYDSGLIPGQLTPSIRCDEMRSRSVGRERQSTHIPVTHHHLPPNMK